MANKLVSLIPLLLFQSDFILYEIDICIAITRWKVCVQFKQPLQ